MPRAVKKAAAKKKTNNIRVISTEVVPLESLTMYDKNPRIGNVRLVAESLMESGQYRPIVVRVQSDGKRITPEILAGNHTWKGAVFLDACARGTQSKPQWLVKMESKHGQVEPWSGILVSFIDANDEESKRIVLADNRTAEAGGYDNDILQELVRSLPDASGTGFTEDEYNLIVRASEESAQQVINAVEQIQKLDEFEGNADSVTDIIFNSNVGDRIDQELHEPEPLHDEPEEMKDSMVDLKEAPEFKGVTQFEIPPLRPDMLIEDLPVMETWSGSATRDWPDEDVVWFYNYGIDSTSGMKVKPGNLVLAFYCWDEYFDTWWDYTKDRTAQALNSKVRMAITPNFSQGGMPMAQSIYNLFRSRYVGRYLQEAGIKVIPDLECRPDDLIYGLIKATLPTELAWGSIQVQNITAKTRREDIDVKDRLKEWESETIRLFETVRPANLLVYANTNGYELISDLNDKKGWGMNLRYQQSRLVRLGEQAKGRKKKTGIV